MTKGLPGQGWPSEEGRGVFKSRSWGRSRELRPQRAGDSDWGAARRHFACREAPRDGGLADCVSADTEGPLRKEPPCSFRLR